MLLLPDPGPPRKVDMDTPICADPRAWVVVVVCVLECCVHCNAPSRWKIRSCLDTCAGVRSVTFFSDGVGVVGSRSSSSARPRSESRSAEKTMLARCRFRLVIWTARTAA